MQLDSLYASLSPLNKWAEVRPSALDGYFGAFEYAHKEFTHEDGSKRMRFGQRARILNLTSGQIKLVNEGDESVLDELVNRESDTPGLFLIKNTCHLVTVDNIVLPIPGNPAQLFEFSPIRQ